MSIKLELTEKEANAIKADALVSLLQSQINELKEENLKLTKKIGDLYKQKKAHMEENRRLWGLWNDADDKMVEVLKKIAYPVTTLEAAQEVAKQALKGFE